MALDLLATQVKNKLKPLVDADLVERIVSPLYYQIRPLNPAVRAGLQAIDFPQIDNSQTDEIALFPDFYPGTYRTVFKSLVAHVLYQKGVGSAFIFGDKTLPTCRKKESSKDCVKCMKRSTELVDSLGLTAYDIGDFTGKHRDIPEDSQRRINLAAESTIRGKFKIAEIDRDDDRHAHLLQQFKAVGQLGWDMAAGADDSMEYEYLVVNMGPGLPVRSVVEYGHYADKKIVGLADPSFGRGGGYIFNKGERPLTIYMGEEKWETIKERPLNDEKQSVLEEFMDERFANETYQQYANRDVDVESRLRIDIDESTTVYVLFTHLLWDAAIARQVARVFEDHNDWLFSTIDEFHGREDVLVIKSHPAEKLRGTNQSVLDVIAERYGELPENINLLPPGTEINTYDLVDFADVPLVFTSTTGLESAYKGKPVITVGDAHYANKGFTRDAKSIEEYLTFLRTNPSELALSDAEHQLALQYAYNFFIERPFYVNAINPPQLDGSHDRLLEVDTYEEILADPTLDRLGESIVEYDDWFYNR